MILVPLSLKEANAFVSLHHRHRPPVVGAKFCLGLANATGAVLGVCIVGRPVARGLDDGRTLEVNRLCTTGAANACSMLYGAAWRAAKALGYTGLVTYTLATEPGTSLRAAGWRVAGSVRGRSWSCASRPRDDEAKQPDKIRWEAPGPLPGLGIDLRQQTPGLLQGHPIESEK